MPSSPANTNSTNDFGNAKETPTTRPFLGIATNNLLHASHSHSADSLFHPSLQDTPIIAASRLSHDKGSSDVLHHHDHHSTPFYLHRHSTQHPYQAPSPMSATSAHSPADSVYGGVRLTHVDHAPSQLGSHRLAYPVNSFFSWPLFANPGNAPPNFPASFTPNEHGDNHHNNQEAHHQSMEASAAMFQTMMTINPHIFKSSGGDLFQTPFRGDWPMGHSRRDSALPVEDGHNVHQVALSHQIHPQMVLSAKEDMVSVDLECQQRFRQGSQSVETRTLDTQNSRSDDEIGDERNGTPPLSASSTSLLLFSHMNEEMSAAVETHATMPHNLSPGLAPAAEIHDSQQDNVMGDIELTIPFHRMRMPSAATPSPPVANRQLNVVQSLENMATAMQVNNDASHVHSSQLNITCLEPSSRFSRLDYFQSSEPVAADVSASTREIIEYDFASSSDLDSGDAFKPAPSDSDSSGSVFLPEASVVEKKSKRKSRGRKREKKNDGSAKAVKDKTPLRSSPADSQSSSRTKRQPPSRPGTPKRLTKNNVTNLSKSLLCRSVSTESLVSNASNSTANDPENLTGLSKATIRRRKSTKTYPCLSCDRVFSRSDALAVHSYSHMEYDERPFPCDQCDLRFCRRHDYQRHIASCHLDIRPHTCENCNWSFSRSDALARHKKWCGRSEGDNAEEEGVMSA
ncbi:hypothetical protein HDV05_000842 [Chytridiales sp. JEL 0842]|nr:hypothetical protein HDV05_000842 [Chytridiales sp. JEL 0842]